MLNCIGIAVQIYEERTAQYQKWQHSEAGRLNTPREN